MTNQQLTAIAVKGFLACNEDERAAIQTEMLGESLMSIYHNYGGPVVRAPETGQILPIGMVN